MNPTDRPVRAFDVRLTITRRGTILVKSREAYELNEVASQAWERLDGQNTLKHIADEIALRYEICADTAYTDIAEFAQDLLSLEMIELGQKE